MADNIIGQLEALLEGDLVMSYGPALIKFLQNIQASQGDRVKQAAALVQLQGDVIGASPFALGGLESQLAQVIAARIQALMNLAPSVSSTLSSMSNSPATPSTGVSSSLSTSG